MKRSVASIVLYVLLVFLSGVLVGVVGFGIFNTRVARPGSAPGREEMLKRYREELRTRLNLRPEQVRDMDAILEDTHNRFRQLREKWRPEVRAIMDEQTERLRALLDDRQKTEYDRMREEREKQHQAPLGGHH
jgi:hypothetical protein